VRPTRLCAASSSLPLHFPRSFALAAALHFLRAAAARALTNSHAPPLPRPHLTQAARRLRWKRCARRARGRGRVRVRQRRPALAHAAPRRHHALLPLRARARAGTQRAHTCNTRAHACVRCAAQAVVARCVSVGPNRLSGYAFCSARSLCALRPSRRR
jgi:hypothetical protein